MSDPKDPQTELAESENSQLKLAKQQNDLGWSYFEQGRYVEAEPLLRQALEIRQRELGDDDAITAQSFNNLAGLYQTQGRYAAAEPLLQKALKIRKVRSEQEPTKYAAALNNFAGLYDDQGRLDKAEPLYQQALEIDEKVCGKDHIKVATKLNNLASLYQSQQKYEKAELFYQRALGIWKKEFGENDYRVAIGLNNLAELYNNQEKYAEAEPLYLQALEIDKNTLGENHPDYATDLNNLAGLYYNQRQYEKAEQLYLQALEIIKNTFSEVHPNQLLYLKNLVRLYEVWNKLEQVDQYRNQIEKLEYGLTVTSLHLNHFRSANEQQFSFHEKLNIFFGENGVGKSTTLDALAKMFSWGVENLREVGKTGRPIEDWEITNGESEAELRIECLFGESVTWQVQATREGHTQLQPGTQQVSNLAEWAARVQRRFTDDPETPMPVFVHYPVNRAVVDVPLDVDQRVDEKHDPLRPFAAYDQALEGGANFHKFFEWFRKREDFEREQREEQGESDFSDLQLNTVRQALQEFLPDFENFRVQRSPLQMLVDKHGEKFDLRQLSDGEKCLIALVGDLARRLTMANPKRDDPLQGHGIVLIDEVDLHLHPKWQRMVAPQLMQVFPNCQLFISTHSPHVLNHIKPDEGKLFYLSQGEVSPPPEHPYGKTAEIVLADTMGLKGTRPRDVEEKLDQISHQIDSGEKEKLNQAEEELQSLKAEMGFDPDLSRLKRALKRARKRV